MGVSDYFYDYDIDEDPKDCKYCHREMHWELDMYDRWQAFNPDGSRHLCKEFLKTVRSTPDEDFD